jgi:hypothetical protein
MNTCGTVVRPVTCASHARVALSPVASISSNATPFLRNRRVAAQQ